MMTELLAPAGSIDCAYAAVHSGAGAVYLGVRAFSARASAENFDEESLSSFLRYAKVLGVKVYLAMNTMVKEEELPAFFDTLQRGWNLGVDAVILQDVALGQYIHQRYPEVCLHLSTQAGVCNVEGAKFAKECGFSRVILARETPLSEIEKITKIIETEAFVQGALCTCFSGQCYFSSFVGGNSGNRGRCKQPCRKVYAFDRAGYEEKAYALSPADLSIGKEIEKLQAAGVTSFKIEGRMRRAEYVAAATAYYRSLLDKKEECSRLSALKRTYNRGNYTKGLGFGQEKDFLSRRIQGHLGEKVGVVKVENKQYVVESAFQPVAGDAFKILRKGKEVGGAFFAGSTRRGFFVTSKERLQAGDSVFVTTDTALAKELLAVKKTRSLSLSLSFIEGERAVASADGVSYVSPFVLQSALNKALDEEELKSCFLKTDGLPIEIDFERVRLEGNIFIPKSQLNEFRRGFYAKWLENLTSPRTLSLSLEKEEDKEEKGAKIKGVIARDFARLQAVDVAVYKPDDYQAKLPLSFTEGDFQKYLYCPAFCTGEELQQLVKIVKENGLDGLYAENFSALQKAKEENLRCFVGTGFNVSNRIAVRFWESQEAVTFVALSKELSKAESRRIASLKTVKTVGGGIKLMDLCYCPFEKTCKDCDKRTTYTMTDAERRAFPVHRYTVGGKCRFEIYNSARLIAAEDSGLADYTLTEDIKAAFDAWESEEAQKNLQKPYTYGHAKSGVL